MKKIFAMTALVCGLTLTLLLPACTGSAPKTVVDAALTALKAGDTEALLDCIYMDEELAGVDSWRDLEGDLPKALKRQIKIVESTSPMIRRMLKNVTWKFGSVERDGDEATVVVKMKRGDEDEIESRVKVVKDKGGNWKIKSMGDLL